MNVHHLELFYHVVRNGGVSAAARRMPYGIQQSTISAQILRLEDHLGKTLFRRRPFELTVEGRALFEHIEPFFSGLEPLACRLRGGAENHLRIACPELVQLDYLPALLDAMRGRVPGFHFSLESARGVEIAEGIRAGRIDVGLATMSDDAPAGMQVRPLLHLPMVLMVPEPSDLTNAGSLLAADRIDLPLLALPSAEPACRMFQEELQRRGIDWFPALELASLDLIARYVAAGFGIGLGIRLPGMKSTSGVRCLDLDGFPSVLFSAWIPSQASPLAMALVEEAEQVARKLAS